MQPIIDDQRNIHGGIGALQLPNDPHRLIADIVDAAHDLNPARIVLEAKTLEVGVQTGLRAMERFQDCNKGALAWRLGLSPRTQMAFDLETREKSVTSADQS